MNLNPFFFLRRQPAPIPVRYIVATSSDNTKARQKREKTTAELRAFVDSQHLPALPRGR